MSFDVDVRRRLGRRQIAQRFTAGSGLTVLLGPSGSGKTSVLNMIAGLLRPDEGRIMVGDAVLFDRAAGIDRKPEARRIGYVMQDLRLFPHRSVRANLRYGFDLVPPTNRWIGFDAVIGLLGLEPLLDRWPATLSGGEAQRVAIGRALLASPRALLLDEPLSSIDQPRRAAIMTAIERIRDELAIPILYVTHDPAETERLASQVVPIDP